MSGCVAGLTVSKASKDRNIFIFFINHSPFIFRGGTALEEFFDHYGPSKRWDLSNTATQRNNPENQNLLS
jgi:hypothetical protein